MKYDWSLSVLLSFHCKIWVWQHVQSSIKPQKLCEKTDVSFIGPLKRNFWDKYVVKKFRFKLCSEVQAFWSTIFKKNVKRSNRFGNNYQPTCFLSFQEQLSQIEYPEETISTKLLYIIWVNLHLKKSTSVWVNTWAWT